MAKNTSFAGNIKSIGDIEKLVKSVKGNGRILFRGQNVDKPLLPRIARIFDEKGLTYEAVCDIERRMLDRFKRESTPFLGGIRPRTEWDWLSLLSTMVFPHVFWIGRGMRLPRYGLQSQLIRWETRITAFCGF